MSSNIGLLEAVFGELIFIVWGFRELYLLRGDPKKPKDDPSKPREQSDSNPS
jgi:hypothetical protein